MKKSFLALAAASALLLSSAVSAQGFIGIGAGTSRVAVDCAGLTTCDKTDTGYKLYGGFTFANQFAAELVYFDWGKARGTGTIIGLGTGSGEAKATGFGIGAAYYIPLGTNWTGALRLGVAENEGKTTLSDATGSVTDKFRSTQPYYGLGIGYKLTPNLAIMGEADFSRVKYTDSDKADVQLLSIGIRYSF